MRRLLAVLVVVLSTWLGASNVFAQQSHDGAGDPRGHTTQGARDLVDDPAIASSLIPPPLPPGWVTVQRGPLTISYPPSMDRLVGPTLATAEQSARSVGTQLGLSVLPAMSVRLVPDTQVMRALAPAAAPPPRYAVGVAYPAVRLTLVSASAPRTWEASEMQRVLRHELSHLCLAEATNHAVVPRWLAEGLAVEQAEEHSFERFESLARASFTGGVMPLARLDEAFNAGPEQVDVAYAQSADFVSYLIRTDGIPRFTILLAHIRTGMELPDAVRETYGTTLTDIEGSWRRDMQNRFAFAPLWAGTGLVWVVGLGLMGVAMVRRRRRSREIVARWAREERLRLARSRLARMTSGLALVRPYGEGDRNRQDVETGASQGILDARRHTLH